MSSIFNERKQEFYGKFIICLLDNPCKIGYTVFIDKLEIL